MSEINMEKNRITLEQVGDLVAAYVSNNHIAAADLPALIATVHAAVSGLSAKDPSVTATGAATQKAAPADVKKSIRPEGIISFIDGKTYKTLKRHLTSHGLNPDSYRERFGLPGDYPMVALAYSEKRSSLAKSLGLGKLQAGKAQVEAKPTPKGQKKAA
ncbi:MucR family transcriptional regulator [Methylobacterium sp. J-067]|uniref:MucR family transcriptional regulator n=1 Tax=Methylobacterium sp. J-067 TaxID=2836648 RepID=UPI001FB8B4E7|nr:MucR family transcriptional regulator [Methylobacterium sp. J-067]MCJ2023619.1 MucR family transcriptional regulator [Methylobacterium sp. J-067]